MRGRYQTKPFLVALLPLLLACSSQGGDDGGVAGSFAMGGSGRGGASSGGAGASAGGAPPQLAGSPAGGSAGMGAPTAGAPSAGAPNAGAPNAGAPAAGGGSGSGGAASGGSGGSGGTGGSSGSGGAASGSGGLSGTSGAGGSAGQSGGGEFVLSSPKHTQGAVFADEFTCAGKGVSPPLAWTPGPSGTKSYAITFLDTTLVEKGNANGYHWVLWDIPASTTSLPGELPAGATLSSPVSAKQNAPANPFDDHPANRYFGPCPNAVGNTNNTDEYAFTIYALGVETLSGANLSGVRNIESAIKAAPPLATAVLSGSSTARPD